MRKAIPYLAPACLLLSACSAAGIGSVPGLGPGSTPLDHAAYMAEASAAEQFQIQASQLAVAKAQRPEVRLFAKRLLGDHSRAAAQLVRAAEHEGLAPPTPVLSAGQVQMLAALQAAAPGEFDGLFLDQQIATDGSTYWLHRRFALVGDEKKLRTIAANGSFQAHDHRDRARKLD